MGMKFCAQCKTFYNDLSFTTINRKQVCFHCYNNQRLEDQNGSADKILINNRS